MRKFSVFVFLLLCAISQAFAQAKPIYFNGNRITSDPNSATSYGVYGKLSGQDLWVLKRYDLYDNLMLSGSYKDEQLSAPHGEFIFYSSILDYNIENYTNFKAKGTDRYISQRGKYVNGAEEGTWYDYFPDGVVMGIHSYRAGKPEGEITQFNHKGKLLFRGQFKEGLKVGTWYDLKRRTKKVFDNDKLISETRLTKAEIQTLEQD